MRLYIQERGNRCAGSTIQMAKFHSWVSDFTQIDLHSKILISHGLTSD